MARKLLSPIFLGVFTVLAIFFLTGGADDDKDELRQTFQVNAVYYDTGHVEVAFSDKSEKTDSVVMEILGMEETYQKTFSSPAFIEIVPFPGEPKYGWEIHPVVLEIDHPELGHVQLKTEIYQLGDSAPPVIYSRP
ncbi:hypothetical protein [Nitrosopumilus maritimus]|uniref:Uncharacterized protein n=1 Tax=Nitrosopumilus maritimus (strain SCM1) TaxID=436308 RepID=A9A2E1_NITMS|nr:hypothetical protein [Nitrosopumilus maritimus]ABX12852.1 hypothetical protein Nmar_0956 [Nitrosopumilus maritimus SCM1]